MQQNLVKEQKCIVALLTLDGQQGELHSKIITLTRHSLKHIPKIFKLFLQSKYQWI